MVANVTFEKTTYNVIPFKFEAGTTNFTGAIGLAAALDYLSALGREAVACKGTIAACPGNCRTVSHRRYPYLRHYPAQGLSDLIPAGNNSPV